MLGGSSWGAFRCPSADSGFMEAPPTSRSATAHRSPALDHDKKWSCHREPPPATTSGRAEPARAGRVKALPRPRSHALGRWRARLDRGGLSPVSAQAPLAQEYRADNDRPGPRRTRTRAGSHTRRDGRRAAGAGSRPRRSSTTAPTAATSRRKTCTRGTCSFSMRERLRKANDRTVEPSLARGALRSAGGGIAANGPTDARTGEALSRVRYPWPSTASDADRTVFDRSSAVSDRLRSRESSENGSCRMTHHETLAPTAPIAGATLPGAVTASTD